jgi:hypothetical protein
MVVVVRLAVHNQAQFPHLMLATVPVVEQAGLPGQTPFITTLVM